MNNKPDNLVQANLYLHKEESIKLREELLKINTEIDNKRQGLIFIKDLLDKVENEVAMLEQNKTEVWHKLYNASAYLQDNILDDIEEEKEDERTI